MCESQDRLEAIRAAIRQGRETRRADAPPGAPRRPEAQAAWLADARGVRGVRRRAVRGPRLRGRAGRRHRRPGGRPPRPTPRSARHRAVQVSQQGASSARPSSRSSWAPSTTRTVTRGSLSPPARSRSPPRHSPPNHPIELIDGPRLVELVQEAARSRRPPRARARLVLSSCDLNSDVNGNRSQSRPSQFGDTTRVEYDGRL